jgi:hypothetical protein
MVPHGDCSLLVSFLQKSGHTLSNGTPIETVSNLLGYRSISTTQTYAKVLENKVSEDMVKLKKRLSGNKAKVMKGNVG